MMYIELESLGQVLRVEGSSLCIGNELDEGVYVDDISSLEGTELYKKITELEKELRGALTELKDIAIDKVKRNELKGVIDEANEVA
ncbi:hypothetical protein CP960_06130 [Malaciobacter halophilus]|uniref:Uncharacterized protein n=1 Tax=Malaciobacter halophilus TaxID=197482 RepID=A0A2N1J3J0_9BACT|nr:hypothetical protein [Malaciobacter halophilus]AXH09068.1 hypothetical protein AHALO_0682 [Malaciobacter halophilus]PKI81135.1 hypothetical protein CP960_06130 [Malaciobacter halophilus]